MAAVRLNNAFVAANLAIDPGLIYRRPCSVNREVEVKQTH